MPRSATISRCRLVAACWLGALPAATALAEGILEGDVVAPRLLREASGPAAPIGVLPFGFQPPAPLTAFQPAGVSTRLRRVRLQFEALSADGAWDEAIDLVEQLQADTVAELCEVDGEAAEGPKLYTPAEGLCNRLLASLPTEGREAYRLRRERSARDRVDAALLELDAAELEGVAREGLATESAGEALVALAELALERGDTTAVRRWCRLVHPLLSDPLGLPADGSLVRLSPTIEPDRLAEAWRADPRPPGPSATAEGLIPPALLRMTLASLAEGDHRRAAAELRLLEALAPGVEGRLAGRNQPIAPALRELIASEASSHTSPPEPRRPRDFAWAWNDAIACEPEATPPLPGTEPVRGFQLNQFGQFVPIPAAPPAAPSAFAGRTIATHRSEAFFLSGDLLHRINLLDGGVTKTPIGGLASAPNRPGTPDGDDLARRRALQTLLLQRGVAIRQQQPNQVNLFLGAQPPALSQAARFDPAISLSGGRLFIRRIEAQRVVRAADGTVAAATDESLLAIDPSRPDSDTLRLSPPTPLGEAAEPVGKAPFQFASPPTVRGDRLYVAVARAGSRADLALACYSASTGRLLWRRDLGAGEPLSPLHGAASAAPVAEGDSVYVLTNLGAVASLDARDGRLRWIATYARRTSPTNRYLADRPDATGCALVGDRLVVAPSDAEQVLSFDTSTGRTVWKAPRPLGARLLGTVDVRGARVAVLAGQSIVALDVLTGLPRYAWPESPRAGLRGSGGAALYGDEVFWPTRDAIYVLDPATGAPTREPLPLRTLGEGGANLVATPYGLLVCGRERLRLLAALIEEN